MHSQDRNHRCCRRQMKTKLDLMEFHRRSREPGTPPRKSQAEMTPAGSPHPATAQPTDFPRHYTDFINPTVASSSSPALLDDTELSHIPVRPPAVYLSPPKSQSTTPFDSSTTTINECCAPKRTQPATPRKMGLSKSQRIGILLAIDSAFFVLELVVGKWQEEQKTWVYI